MVLHQQKIFKFLHLIFVNENLHPNVYPPEFLALVKYFYSQNPYDKITLSHMVKLEKLYFINKNQITDLNASPITKLTELKRVDTYEIDTQAILPFVANSKKLTDINIVFRENLNDDDEEVIHPTLDLSALNKARSKLKNSSKLTISVREPFYLATMDAFKGMNLNSIKFKRFEF